VSVTVVAYTIYHSPNAYLGHVLAERALAGLPVVVERRPIVVPRSRGVKVADLVGGREADRHARYHREDCLRWARRHGIPFEPPPPAAFAERAARWAASPLAREELPARAYYAAVGSGTEAALDRALFRAAWVLGLDVNDEEVVRRAAATAGLDPDRHLAAAMAEGPGDMVRAALDAFDRDECPGVPTWVVAGERFWGKDRVDWLAARVRELAGAPA
jgi:2-hydroxychromene-2-carboxylate isomerase